MEKELKEELFDYFDENEVEALPILMQEILAEFQKLRADVKWLFDDFAWDDHWRECPIGEEDGCMQCTDLAKLGAHYGWR